MNIRYLLFFVSIISISAVSKAEKASAHIYFIQTIKMQDNLFELNYLIEERQNSVKPLIVNGIPYPVDEVISKQLTEAFEKIIPEGIAFIAKSLGANAVLPTPDGSYIDPVYDITQKVVDHLNKEYIKRRYVFPKIIE